MNGDVRYEEILFADALFPIRVLWDVEMGREPLPRSITWHEQLEILVFYAGQGECECDLRRYSCGPGDILIINPCEGHAIRPLAGTLRYHCLMIDLSLCDSGGLCGVKYIRPILQRQIRFRNRVTDNPRVRAVIQALTEACRREDPGSELMVKGELLRLLAVLVGEERTDVKPLPSGHGQIAPALAYIADHYAGRVTVGRLAEACCMDKSYFCRRFRAITGSTAMDYTNMYRLAKARALVITTDLSVSRIAEATGFGDSSYFTRRFRSVYGVTPTALRGSTDGKEE